jgi:hypothetical protein
MGTRAPFEIHGLRLPFVSDDRFRFLTALYVSLNYIGKDNIRAIRIDRWRTA